MHKCIWSRQAALEFIFTWPFWCVFLNFCFTCISRHRSITNRCVLTESSHLQSHSPKTNKTKFGLLVFVHTKFGFSQGELSNLMLIAHGFGGTKHWTLQWPPFTSCLWNDCKGQDHVRCWKEKMKTNVWITICFQLKDPFTQKLMHIKAYVSDGATHSQIQLPHTEQKIYSVLSNIWGWIKCAPQLRGYIQYLCVYFTKCSLFKIKDDYVFIFLFHLSEVMINKL